MIMIDIKKIADEANMIDKNPYMVNASHQLDEWF